MEGIQLGLPSLYDIVAPLTATQCEPFLIYYNMSRYSYLPSPAPQILILEGGTDVPSDILGGFLKILFPPDVGYMSWTCNIPAGQTFRASAAQSRLYVVQNGTSDCLGDLRTTYQYAQYQTSSFASYTKYATHYSTSLTTTAPDYTYPTVSYPTITANQNIGSPSSIPASSSSSASPTDKFIVIGAAIGVVIIILATAWVIRRRRGSTLGPASRLLARDSDSEANVGLVMGRVGRARRSMPAGPSRTDNPPTYASLPPDPEASYLPRYSP